MSKFLDCLAAAMVWMVGALTAASVVWLLLEFLWFGLLVGGLIAFFWALDRYSDLNR